MTDIAAGPTCWYTAESLSLRVGQYYGGFGTAYMLIMYRARIICMSFGRGCCANMRTSFFPR